jgi:hypothetical protein
MRTLVIRASLLVLVSARRSPLLPRPRAVAACLAAPHGTATATGPAAGSALRVRVRVRVRLAPGRHLAARAPEPRPRAALRARTRFFIQAGARCDGGRRGRAGCG